MNFNQRGQQSFLKRAPKACGETVHLRRSVPGGYATIVITGAMRSPNSVIVSTSEQLSVTLTLVDWWLPVSQVVFDTLSSPMAGDNVPRMSDELTAADGTEFEPMRPGAGSDAAVLVAMDNFWLIHTKQTGMPVPVV